MPFFVYHTSTKPTGPKKYDAPRRITLAGNGLIRTACSKFMKSENTGWRLDAADLLSASGTDPASHALVIDTAPSRSTVSLFEVRAICGYSFADWTPIMEVLEQLFADAPAKTTPEATKLSFTDEACERCIVRSFLYLKGGHASGDWNWGGNSRTTAALLWDEAWTFFQGQAT